MKANPVWNATLKGNIVNFAKGKLNIKIYKWMFLKWLMMIIKFNKKQKLMESFAMILIPMESAIMS